jgi:hypothetical protein
MWTRFMDMHSGGGLKEQWQFIYIEAPEDEAKIIFYNRFGHNPERVTCTCCGNDYSIEADESLKQLTGYDRHCDNLETPRDERGLYKQPNDPWFKAHYYLEPEDVAEAIARGYKVKENLSRDIARQYPESADKYSYKTLEQYMTLPEVLFIRADEIKPEERTGSVPEQGYVWV